MTRDGSQDAVSVQPQAATTANIGRLDRAALHGAAWMGAAKWSSQLISWLGTILVARILAPADYGIVAMASVYLGLLSMVSEFGIGTTIVTRRDIDELQLRQLNVVAAVLGVVGVLCSAAFAWPLGWFFRSDQLPLVVIAMSAAFALNGFQVVPAATLRRELKFSTLATIDIARGFLIPIGTYVLAILGFRYWSLVGGALLSSAVSLSMTLIQRRHGFARPVWSTLGSKVHFSIQVLISRIAWFAYSSADLVVAGRQLGEVRLGEYSLAVTLATAPTDKIFSLLTEVTPALFAAVQTQREALRRYFLNMTELLAFVCFPVGVGLSLVSQDLVAVLLGSKWEGVVLPLMLLAAYSIVRGLTPLYGHLFVAVGQSLYSMWLGLVTAVVMPLAFVVGSHWGTTGIAAAWIVGHPILTLVTFHRVRHVLDLRGRDYLQSLRLGLDGSVVMCACVWSLRTWAPIHDLVARLVTEVGVGAAVFTAATLLIHGRRLKEIIGWLRRTRSGA